MKSQFFALLVLIFAAGTVSAVPIEYSGTVLNNDNWSNYSLVHQGSGPSGAGDRNDWLRFSAGQAFNFFYDTNGGFLSTSGLDVQSFELFSANGATATLEVLGFNLDLNDDDGFLGGVMNYNLITQGSPIADIVNGAFQFQNINMGVFNSVNFAGDALDQAFLWGGDYKNMLGIDFSFDGVAVPEPASMILFALGLGGLAVSARGRKRV